MFPVLCIFAVFKRHFSPRLVCKVEVDTWFCIFTLCWNVSLLRLRTLASCCTFKPWQSWTAGLLHSQKADYTSTGGIFTVGLCCLLSVPFLEALQAVTVKMQSGTSAAPPPSLRTAAAAVKDVYFLYLGDNHFHLSASKKVPG